MGFFPILAKDQVSAAAARAEPKGKKRCARAAKAVVRKMGGGVAVRQVVQCKGAQAVISYHQTATGVFVMKATCRRKRLRKVRAGSSAMEPRQKSAI